MVGLLPIAVQIIAGLVVMPQLVRYFGDRYFGLWVLVGVLLGYFGMLDLGFSKTIVRYVSAALGRNDREASNGWITIGLLLFTVSSALGFCVLITIVWACKFFVTEDLDLIRSVLLVGGSAFLIALPSRCAIGVLQAHVRGDVMDGIVTISSVLNVVALLCGLYFKASFLAFIWILAIFTLVKGVGLSVAAIKIHGRMQLRSDWVTRDNLKKFAGYSASSFIAQLGDLLRFQAYPLIISGFLGLSAVTTFEIANRIRTILGRVHNGVLVNFTAVFSRIEARAGIGAELKDAYLLAYKIACYFVLFTGGMTMIVAHDFVIRWMGPRHEESVLLLLVAMGGTLAAGIQIPTVCFLFGTSRHRFYAISNTCEAVLIVVSAVLLVRPFGLLGMVVGASLSTFFIKTFIQPLWVARLLKMSLFELHVWHTLPHLLRMGVFFAVAYFVAGICLAAEYWLIISFGVGVSCLFLPYIWFFGFSRSERRSLYDSVPALNRLGCVARAIETTL